MKELRGIIDSNTFKIRANFDVGKQTRIVGSRFVDSIKIAETCAQYKSRLVAGNYGDDHSAAVENRASTVLEFTQRLLLYVTSPFKKECIYTKHVTKAHIQLNTLHEKKVFIRPSQEIELALDKALKITKP